MHENGSGEQMLNKWFAVEPARDGSTAGQGYEVPRDGEQPMRDLEAETSEPDEIDADMDAELPSVDIRPWAPAAELVEVGDRSDVVAEGVTAADAQERPVAEDDVTAPSYAAARLLEIAASNAEALVETARAQADQLQTQAHARAEQILQAGLADAEAREAAITAREEELRAREDELRAGLERARAEAERELEARRAEAERELEARRAEVEERVEQLLQFEGELRTYLISYFDAQQEMLHRSPVVTLMATADAAKTQVS
jgi:hypothetical protein